MTHENILIQARQILREVFGFQDFRAQQSAIITALCTRKNVLALMPTGAGKSLCYQIPALMMNGLTLVISPLIALMDDQVTALRLAGISAAALHSGRTPDEIRQIAEQMRSGSLKLLYVAPERAVSERFLSFLQDIPLSLLAIDEAHCVSQWGHDFRPEYRQLHQIWQRFPHIQRIAMTATADQQTREDIIQRLELHNAEMFISSFDRPNIDYQVIEKNHAKEQLLQFIEVQGKNQCGIVYCHSRKRVEEIAKFLQEHRINALPYHAGLETEIRSEHQKRFSREDNIIMVATVAFGMGIDKPDVRFVAHIDLPRSIENFYQESGRAGRDGLPSISWLCYGLNDIMLTRERILSSNIDNERKNIELGKLNDMVAFCEQSSCRRQYLLCYFGEETEACHHCDNCRQPPEQYDATIHVQKLLSAIWRVGQNQNATDIIDILRGKSLHHRDLSVFGIGADLSVREWRSIVRQCFAQGIVQVRSQWQTLQLTDLAVSILKNKTPVSLRHIRRYKAKSNYTGNFLTERQENLRQALREWRLEYAKDADIPAFVIFNDCTLMNIVEIMPTTFGDLSNVEGLGEKKINDFGEDILAICRKIKNGHKQAS